MRMVLLGLAGGVLVVGGLVVGTAGVGLLLAEPCTPTYRLAVQPVEAAADPPERSVAVGSLTEQQRTAVEAAIDGRTRLALGDRAPLEPLTDVVIEAAEGRYVAEIVTNPCRSPYDELAAAGGLGVVVGGFLATYALVGRRLS